eukprot:Pgem_evm1s15902
MIIYRKMYCSGDIVKWNEKGCLEFIGKAKNVVKKRGLIVNTKEIASLIVSDASVSDAI